MKRLEISQKARTEIKEKYSEVLKSDDKEVWKSAIMKIKIELAEIDEKKKTLAIEDTKILSSFRRGYILNKVLYIILDKFGKKFIKPKYL
jgi:hypothetical protein